VQKIFLMLKVFAEKALAKFVAKIELILCDLENEENEIVQDEEVDIELPESVLQARFQV
jgi:hypothetical protein